MKKLILQAFLTFALVTGVWAQSVQQSGVVTPGHSAQWLTNGVIGDSGAPSGGVGLLGSFVINDMLCSNATGTTISIIDCGFSATGTNNWVGLQNLNGGATAPTRAPGDSTTNVATTAFVQAYNASLLSTPNTWTAMQTFSAGLLSNNFYSTAGSFVVNGLNNASGTPNLILNDVFVGNLQGGGVLWNVLNSTPASVTASYENCGLQANTAGSERALCDKGYLAPSSVNQIITTAINSPSAGCVLCTGNTNNFWALGTASAQYANIFSVEGTFSGQISGAGGSQIDNLGNASFLSVIVFGPTSGSSSLLSVNNQDGTHTAETVYNAAGVAKWEEGKNGSGNYFLFDDVGGQNVITVIANGAMTLNPVGQLNLGSSGSKVDIVGQLISTAGLPTIASGACGATTNGAVVAGSTNQSGNITIGSATTTTCTLTWSATLSVVPNACVFFPANAAAAATGTTVAFVSSITNAHVILTGSALANANYGYICL